jgi:hypothetical protein
MIMRARHGMRMVSWHRPTTAIAMYLYRSSLYCSLYQSQRVHPWVRRLYLCTAANDLRIVVDLVYVSLRLLPNCGGLVRDKGSNKAVRNFCLNNPPTKALVQGHARHGAALTNSLRSLLARRVSVRGHVHVSSRAQGGAGPASS